MMSKRIYWLDISKGIAILLMILGHSSIPNTLSNFIWLFHMPLFFIASGWSTNWQKTCIKSYSKRKFRTLLLPFFIYSFVVLMIYIYEGWGNLNQLIQDGWGTYALWFIPVLFFASLLAKIIYTISNRNLVLIFAFIFVLIGAIFEHQ